MSGHQRFCGAALLFLAGLWSAPAFSNAFTDLFNVGDKDKEVAAPEPTKAKCALRPGNSTAPGQRWVYHFDGHRKCWFQADETTASVKNRIKHRALRQPAVALEKNEAPVRRREAFDARAQLVTATPVGTPQAAATDTVDNAPPRESAATVPAEPITLQPIIAPKRAVPQSVDVETLLAASTDDQDQATRSEPTITPVALPDDWELMAAPSGVGLIALGFAFLVGSWLTGRSFGPREAPADRTPAPPRQQKSVRRLPSAQPPKFLMR